MTPMKTTTTTPHALSAPLRALHALHQGTLHAHDTPITHVIRAWPGRATDLHAEVHDTNGQLRALHVDSTGHTTVLPYATDPKLPGLSPQHHGRLVVHRWNKRAVTITPTHVHKYLRPGKTRAVADAWAAIDDACTHAGIATPPIESVSDTHLAFNTVQGSTLHDLGDTGMDGWKAFAEAWPHLARYRTLANHYTPADEAHTLNTWYSHVTTHGALAPYADTLGRSIEHTTNELLDTSHTPPTSQWVTTHRDLHDKQIMWDGTYLTLLDADTAVRAEGALDIANLRAHIDLRVLQGVITAPTGKTLRELTSHIADELHVPTQRLNAYEHASRLRLACVYAFRPSAHTWLPQWVDTTLSQHHTLTH